MEENKNENVEKTENKGTLETAPADFKYINAKKLWMTQIYTESGEMKGVTVLEAGPCGVVYTRTKEKDGYNAVCIGYQEKKKNINKPLEGIFKKNGVKPYEHLKEFRFENVDGVKPGQIVAVENRFKEGDWLDVQGRTIGKGFAGAMKRHGFHGQPASHGASDRERAPGSLGSRRSLGRVMPGQRMAGHLGNEMTTIQKIKVVKTMPDKNILMLLGSVPGKNGSIVYVKKTVKVVTEPKQMTSVKSQIKKNAAKAAPKKK
jgi:large subunit ribosomal protein L3